MPKRTVSDLLRELGTISKHDVSLEDALCVFGQRAYAPMFFLLGILFISPIGALPGATAVLGTITAILAIESLFLPSPWLPRALRKRHIRQGKLKNWIKKCQPYVRKAEKLSKTRWVWLNEPPFTYAISIFVLILGVSTYGLGLIPGGLILPGMALAFLGIAQFHSDGLWMSIALILGIGGLSVGLLAV